MRFTDNTICTVSALREELIRVRDQGYALDWEENEVGIRCIAAPVVDPTGMVVASLGISGPTVRIQDEKRDELVGYVLSAARDTSQAAGWSG